MLNGWMLNMLHPDFYSFFPEFSRPSLGGVDGLIRLHLRAIQEEVLPPSNVDQVTVTQSMHVASRLL
jgi:hypothetical protein